MSLTKSAKSPFYQYDFKLNGRRFFGSTKARTKKEAQVVEGQIKAQARTDLDNERKTGTGPMSLDVAGGRYWEEKGKHLANSGTVWTELKRLLDFFGPDTRLDAITDKEVAAFVAWRRGHRKHGKAETKDGDPMPFVAPATVNRTTGLLKAVFTRAERTWRQSLPYKPNWRDHWLPEPEERVRELRDGEGEALDAAMREDYGDWFEFVRLTGLRHAETIIRWSEVNFSAKVIVTTGKGGRTVSTPITPAVQEVLDRCVGHHPVWVFTYICKRPGNGRLRGQRYPLTTENAKTQWRRAKARSGVKDFRLHDIRHDVATKLLRSTGNLKLVQKALNHRNITTTTKYAHVLHDELSEALADLAKSRKKSQNDLQGAQ